MKKVTLALFALAVSFAIPTAALADTITFQYNLTGSVTATHASISTVTGTGTIIVQDTLTADIFTFAGTVTVSSIPVGAGSFQGIPGFIAAGQYLGGAEIEITSPACVGGADPGVCMIGLDNTGGYSGFDHGGAGSFSGDFTPTYISPYITGLFGDQTTTLADLEALNPDGSQDGYGTTGNVVTDNTQIKGNLTTNSGYVNDFGVLNPSPEPSSLLLLGTGLFGLAVVVRRKLTAK